MVSVIAQSEKISKLFLLWHVITIRRKMLEESTYYLSSLEEFRMQDRKRSQKVGSTCRQHSCEEVRVTDMKLWG